MIHPSLAFLFIAIALMGGGLGLAVFYRCRYLRTYTGERP